MNVLLPLSAHMVHHRKLAQDVALFQLQLDDPFAIGPSGENHRPGQFVMLSVPGVGEAPFSICHAAHIDYLELCIRRTGSVTRRLFELGENTLVGLRGPFGNGFPMEKMVGKDVLLIAGGLGLAPLRSVLQYVLQHRESYGRLILVYGMGRQAEALFREDLEYWIDSTKLDVCLAVEHPAPKDLFPADTGHVGMVLERLELTADNTVAAICGPPVMYGPVAKILRSKRLYPENVFFSFERRMECGIGHCGHCAISCRSTCQDGPVFSAWEARSLGEPLEV
ncbi:MAG: FAD/NAD(P)-binding protein [Magnetococcales bacterium]|nr:FAD/NAD(P)-binding protein [Magnetococcales bacterium]